LVSARLATLLSESTLVLVPDFYCCEVANVLWKYVRRGELTPEEAQEGLADALDLADSMAPNRSLAQEALAAATLHGHPVYDMVYAILARRHGCAVVTMDRGLAPILAEMGIPTQGRPERRLGSRPTRATWHTSALGADSTAPNSTDLVSGSTRT
jgi:predicted nucleic acid-binding protein